MAKLTFGRLSEAWTGEAKDFTPLLAEQLDALGDAIGVPLASVGEAEVPTAGNRRIDIVATGDDGSEFVVENQYRTADHDHLTRGLAYAVARRARGLVLVAEEHRDEFRAVAQYLNELAEHDLERGVSVWLVEAKAVRIGDSAWAPLFTAVVEPNEFTATVELAKQTSEYSSASMTSGTCSTILSSRPPGSSTADGSTPEPPSPRPNHMVLRPRPVHWRIPDCRDDLSDGRVMVRSARTAERTAAS